MNLRPPPVQLRSRVEAYLDAALAPSTKRLYASGWRTFTNFARISSFDIYNNDDSLRQEFMLTFVTHCADQLCVSYATIKTYLSAIKYYYARAGRSDPFTFSGGQQFGRLHLILRGIKKIHNPVTLKREPVTVQLLLCMIRMLNKGLYGIYLDSMLKLSFVLAFFGFLRCGEFTTSSDRFDPSHGLTLSDVSLQSSPQQILMIHLSSSKTDPFRKGVTIKLFPLNNILCPLQAYNKYMELRRHMDSRPASPFFLMPSLTPLTRKEFCTFLQGVLQGIGGTSHIKPHSFRIGAATSAAKANIPDHLIKTLGRWSSDSYVRYIRIHQTTLQQAHSDICHLAGY